MANAPGRVLAIDVGDKRIGLAVSDPTRTVAEPLTTLTRRAGKRFPMNQLRRYLDEYHPVHIVIGLPLTPDGDEGPRSAEARRVGALIAAKTGIEISFVDERMSTSHAHGAIRDLGGGTRGRKAEVDQLAASVILQRYFEQRR